jgi:hypothetical protein
MGSEAPIGVAESSWLGHPYRGFMLVLAAFPGACAPGFIRSPLSGLQPKLMARRVSCCISPIQATLTTLAARQFLVLTQH